MLSINTRAMADRIVLLIGLGFAVFSLGARAQSGSSPAQGQSPPSQQQPAQKPKKIWTNDDFDSAQNAPKTSADGLEAGANSASKQQTGKSASKTKDAHWYKQQLARLNAQLADTDRQLAIYVAAKNGENVPNSGVPIYRAKRGDIDAQIALLQKRHNDLTKQLDDLEDEARHKGIAPGDLR